MIFYNQNILFHFVKKVCTQCRIATKPGKFGKCMEFKSGMEKLDTLWNLKRIS